MAQKEEQVLRMVLAEMRQALDPDAGYRMPVKWRWIS